MANLLKIDESEDIKKSSLARLFQSGHINFLIGSGASLPAIITARNKDIEKLFDFSPNKQFWETNFVVVNLNKVNLEMKKTLPLLLSKHLYG